MRIHYSETASFVPMPYWEPNALCGSHNATNATSDRDAVTCVRCIARLER